MNPDFSLIPRLAVTQGHLLDNTLGCGETGAAVSYTVIARHPLMSGWGDSAAPTTHQEIAWTTFTKR